jgi:hypothetical protein
LRHSIASEAADEIERLREGLREVMDESVSAFDAWKIANRVLGEGK